MQVSADPEDAIVKLLMIYVPERLLAEHGNELMPGMRKQLETEPLLQVLLGDPTQVEEWFDEQRKRRLEAERMEN